MTIKKYEQIMQAMQLIKEEFELYPNKEIHKLVTELEARIIESQIPF